MSEEAKTVIRAFELPIHRIERVDGDAAEGWKLIKECWEHSTLLANWCVQQLIRHDVVVLPGMEKLPKRPNIDPEDVDEFGKGLYGLAREQGIACANKPCRRVDGAHWWHGASQTIASITKMVAEKYDQERWDVLWRRSKSLCTYRYPYPWPVNGQSWKDAGFDEAGKPWVIVTLPGGQVKITMRGGAEFGRQLALFKDAVAEFVLAKKEKRKPKVKQLVIRQQPTSNGCHRPTVKDGGRTCRAMCKMVAEVPMREKPGDRTLVLLTDPAAFWVALLDRRPAWIWNGDDYKTHMARLNHHTRHLTRLQRMGEDAKMERRTVLTSTDRFTPEQMNAWESMDNEDKMIASKNRASRQKPRLERMAEKDRRRLDSWTHETAAHLIGFCIRQKVGEVFYLDRDKGFMERFPWHQLHSKVADKLTAAGIQFYSESGLGTSPVVGEELRPGDEEDGKWTRVDRLREAAAKKVVKARSRKGSHAKVSPL